MSLLFICGLVTGSLFAGCSLFVCGCVEFGKVLLLLLFLMSLLFIWGLVTGLLFTGFSLLLVGDVSSFGNTLTGAVGLVLVFSELLFSFTRLPSKAFPVITLPGLGFEEFADSLFTAGLYTLIELLLICEAPGLLDSTTLNCLILLRVTLSTSLTEGPGL